MKHRVTNLALVLFATFAIFVGTAQAADVTVGYQLVYGP